MSCVASLRVVSLSVAASSSVAERSYPYYNWLRLLVPGRWAGSFLHHIFHVRTWNVVLKPEWASAPRTELRCFVFSGFVLQLTVLTAAVFDPADFEQEWHMVLKSELAENIEFTGLWDHCFMSGIESASLFVWDF